MFLDGTFEIGERHLFDVVARDFPTEYAAGEYLAIATLGQPIAVGTLHVYLPWSIAMPYGDRSPTGHTIHEVDLAIVPGRGVWQLEPVFEEWGEPRRRAKTARDALGKALGRDPKALPLSMAYLPVLGRCIGGWPASIDRNDLYLPTVFADPIGILRPTASPEAVDELVARMLEVGHWIDGKSNDRLDFLDTIPAWLADLLPSEEDDDCE